MYVVTRENARNLPISKIGKNAIENPVVLGTTGLFLFDCNSV